MVILRPVSVGAVAVAESDPNVVYAGLENMRYEVDDPLGDGVYKATDAGNRKKIWIGIDSSISRALSSILNTPYSTGGGTGAI